MFQIKRCLSSLIKEMLTLLLSFLGVENRIKFNLPSTKVPKNYLRYYFLTSVSLIIFTWKSFELLSTLTFNNLIFFTEFFLKNHQSVLRSDANTAMIPNGNTTQIDNYFFQFICRAHIGSLLTVTSLFTYVQCGILSLLFHPPTLWVVIATGIGLTS